MAARRLAICDSARMARNGVDERVGNAVAMRLRGEFGYPVME